MDKTENRRNIKWQGKKGIRKFDKKNIKREEGKYNEQDLVFRGKLQLKLSLSY